MKAITIFAILFLYMVAGAGTAMATTLDTSIIIKPSDPSTSNSASFTFSSTIPGSTFRCKLDKEEYKECKGGKIDYSGLQYGPHTFSVKARKDGKYDPTPATYTWIVKVVTKPDSDHDGLSDDDEFKYHTDKDDSDSDNDGVEDGLEIEHGTDPIDSDSDCDDVEDGDEDSDGDGERDGDEHGEKDDSGIDESDSDGLDDEFEDEHDNDNELDKKKEDSDGDMKSDSNEDNDNDGLTNMQEHDFGTNPNDKDSDDDGLNDKEESDFGTDPNDKDSDDDGRTDKEEHDCGTNPNKPDTDDDGVQDGDEYEDETDPKDPKDHNDRDDAPHNKHQNKCAISLTKSADPLIYLYVGEIINYTYVINNTGKVNLTRPFNVFDNKTTVTCPSAPTNLTSGANISCTASYVVTQDDLNNGSIINIANATAYFNSIKVTSNIATATVIAIKTKSLELVKTANPPTYNRLGQIITYTYKITNNGNVALAGIFAVSDDHITGNIDCGFNNLAPGATISCTVQYVITTDDLNADHVTNNANASVNGVVSNVAIATVSKESGGGQIPEFPTVALPIAAVISMVFLFQNRKKKG